jgi:hypothetical protein
VTARGVRRCRRGYRPAVSVSDQIRTHRDTGSLLRELEFRSLVFGNEIRDFRFAIRFSGMRFRDSGFRESQRLHLEPLDP